jgi:hypothetical protein
MLCGDLFEKGRILEDGPLTGGQLLSIIFFFFQKWRWLIHRMAFFNQKKKKLHHETQRLE